MSKQVKRTRTRQEIRATLRRLGITQGAVGKRAGVTASAVCNTLAGRMRSRPILAAARRVIARALARRA